MAIYRKCKRHVAAPDPRNHKTINNSSNEMFHLPSDRHDLRSIITVKESHRFIVPRSDTLLNVFRFFSDIAQGLGGLCTVWTSDHRSGGPRTSDRRLPATCEPFLWTLICQSLWSTLKGARNQMPPHPPNEVSALAKSTTRRSAGLNAPRVQFQLNFVSASVETLIYEVSRQVVRPGKIH